MLDYLQHRATMLKCECTAFGVTHVTNQRSY